MQDPTVKVPENYVKPPFPGGKVLCEELRKPETKQTQSQLKDEQGECCLGVLCRLQGRLIKNDQDDWSDVRDNVYYLANDNPAHKIFGDRGWFPEGVSIEGYTSQAIGALSELNDKGYTFPQIASVIEQIWDCQ